MTGYPCHLARPTGLEFIGVTDTPQRTVGKHRANLLAKTEAQNTADLVRMQVVAKSR